jgi:hypothetical protein
MADNKIVIVHNREKGKKETEIKDITANTLGPIPSTNQEPLYENIWGNDHAVLNKMDENLLADRRLYVRVIYMQKIECNTILEAIGSEPTVLTKPMVFTVIDISIGGIGIISECEINIGTILAFKLTLDNIAYEIKCEVVYCFPNDDKFRAGLKMVEKDKCFTRHLKILVARLSLQGKYGVQANNVFL